MKKLIAIAVVFALVAGAVFAEVNFGGSVAGKVTFAKQKTEGDESVVKNESNVEFGFSTSGQNEEGTFGGRFGFGSVGWREWTELTGRTSTNVWWKPIEQVKLQIGTDEWGNLGGDGALGWGFYQGINDVLVGHDEGDLFGLDGTGTGNGFLLSVYPISGLDIGLWVPIKGEEDPADTYKKILAQVGYNIDGIGSLTLQFHSGTSDVNDIGSTSRAGIGFNLSAVDNLGVFLMGQFGLPLTNDDTKTTLSDRIRVGLSVTYSMGDFGIKFRGGANIGEGAYKTDGGTEDKGTTWIGFGLYPNYKIGDVFVGLGFDARIKNLGEDKGDSVVGWHVSPHLQYNVPGGGSFQVSATFGQKKADDDIFFSIPIRLSFGF